MEADTGGVGRKPPQLPPTELCLSATSHPAAQVLQGAAEWGTLIKEWAFYLEMPLLVKFKKQNKTKRTKGLFCLPRRIYFSALTSLHLWEDLSFPNGKPSRWGGRMKLKALLNQTGCSVMAKNGDSESIDYICTGLLNSLKPSHSFNHFGLIQ